jgi:hypothetical protein
VLPRDLVGEGDESVGHFPEVGQVVEEGAALLLQVLGHGAHLWILGRDIFYIDDFFHKHIWSSCILPACIYVL